MPCLNLTFEDVWHCPLCASSRHHFLDATPDILCVELNRHLPPHQPRFPTLKNTRRICADCSLIFLSPRLDASSLGKLYELWYGYAYRAIFSDPGLISRRAAEFRDRHFRLLSRIATPPGRLLDVGCGSGVFLSVAREAGWQVAGIELDCSAASWAVEHYGLDVKNGSVSSALDEDGQYDAITLFDYLEHSPSPGEDLDRLIAALAPGGVICIRVPNQGGLQSRWMGPAWVNCISNHLSYFTTRSLGGGLVKRGLVIEYVGAPNFQSELDILQQKIRYISSRGAGAARFAGSEPVADPVDAALSGATANDRRNRLQVLGRFVYSAILEQIDHMGGWIGRGNNLMMIARQPS
jgi:SAM-dependent methyltransferase